MVTRYSEFHSFRCYLLSDFQIFRVLKGMIRRNGGPFSCRLKEGLSDRIKHYLVHLTNKGSSLTRKHAVLFLSSSCREGQSDHPSTWNTWLHHTLQGWDLPEFTEEDGNLEQTPRAHPGAQRLSSMPLPPECRENPVEEGLSDVSLGCSWKAKDFNPCFVLWNNNFLHTWFLTFLMSRPSCCGDPKQ